MSIVKIQCLPRKVHKSRENFPGGSSHQNQGTHTNDKLNAKTRKKELGLDNNNNTLVKTTTYGFYVALNCLVRKYFKASLIKSFVCNI